MLWSIEEIKLLKELYPAAPLDILIQSFSDRTISSVRKKAEKLKIKTKVNRFQNPRQSWTLEEKVLLKEIWSKKSKDEISHLFPTRSWMSINTQARKSLRLELNKNSPRLPHFQKLNSLLEDTFISYYWLGFLAADGSLNPKTGCLSISLAKLDKDHLNNFANFINANMYASSIEKKTINKEKSYNTQHVYTVQSKNRKIIEQICKKFDFKVKKTKNAPNINVLKKMSDDLFLSFFIGLVDGDGNISQVGKSGFSIRIECHLAWFDFYQYCEKRLKKIYKEFLSENKINYQSTRINSRGYTQLVISTIIANQLKIKAIKLNLPILQRKWDKIILSEVNF